MHAVCSILNNETFESYNNRVYEQQTSDKKIDETKIILSSCTSHTMNRFCRLLKRKVKFENDHVKRFAGHCFALLLNCGDLESLSIVFELVCWFFCKEAYDEDLDTRIRELKRLVAVKKIDDVNETVNENEAEYDEEFVELDEGSDDEDVKSSTNNTIKYKSPFTKVFEKILKHVESLNITKEDVAVTINRNLNREFVLMLQTNFMPYVAIWTGIALPVEITRVNNGSIEKFW